MGTFMFGALMFSGGLIVGWFLLPAPGFIQKFWMDRGWSDRVQ